MKKIVSTLLVLTFCINIFGTNSSFAAIGPWSHWWELKISTSEKVQKNTYTKNMIISRSELNKTIKWKKYQKTIDYLINWLSNNYSKLKTVKNNLEKLNIDSIRDKQIKNTLTYLEARVNLSLINYWEKAVEEMKESTISNEDKNEINQRIIKLQSSLSNSSKNLLEVFKKEFEETNNIKETWNINLEWSINQEMMWNIDFQIGLNDYEAKNYNFDSELKWQLSSDINWNIDWEEVNFKLDTFIDMISKDWDIYLMLKDLEIVSEQDLSLYNNYIEKVKEVAKENKYIKYSDSESQEAMEILNNLNVDNIKNDIDKYLSKPMLEAYKKEWNKYYIKPTKYACDTIKEVSNKFDPFNWSSCTTSQYNKMLEDLSSAWEFYMIIDWVNTTIGFEWKSDNFVYNKWEIKFDNSKIINFSYDYKDSLWQASIEYNSKNNLDINIKSSLDNSSIVFNSKLDQNNNFTYINAKLESKKSNFNLLLNNWDINGDFKITNSWYNYETWEIEDKSVFSWNIKWTTNRQNKLSSLKIDFKNKDLKNQKNNLTWDFYYDDRNLSLNIEYSDDKTIFVLNSNASMDSNKMINNLNLESKLESKKLKLDNQNYKYIYDENFSDIYDLNIAIKNKNIDWELSIYWEENKEIINIISNGNYSTNSFNINNDITFSKELSKMLNYVNNNDVIKSNFNINYYNNNDNKNLDIVFDAIRWEDKLINIIFEADSNTQSNDEKIKSPSNYIEYEEIFEINNDFNNYYYYQ